ncbi:hypothetical protein IAQ61_002749 [Plenodomus lingam]|uniref:uncharacterized protein n=1 Tax=Leptosphaeria maculans TaxID=5022 RepID=UPI003318CABF|nr:hypothetical protein IAQ61_002749 [Plenodomus lingam]
MQQRNSHDEEPSRQPDNPDVFDDTYEIEPDEDDFMPSSVADGFRPVDTAEGGPGDRQNHERNDAPQRQTSTSKPPGAPGTSLRRMATRNSVAKVHDAMGPDGQSSHRRGPSTPSPLGHRDSVSSAGSFATTSNSENPFELGSGPSHPYGMYPQHTMARPLSVATTSTERQPHRSMSLQRPTHPYAMYSQSGLADDEPQEALPEASRAVVPPVQTAMGPVGFPGLNSGYHRVLGPDGEEQDIIGPDGHTEQLPPYSRYPDEGPTKASVAAELSASRIIPAPVPGAESEDPFNTPVSPSSPASRISFSTPALPVAPALPTVTPARLPPQRPETQTGNPAPANSASAQTIPAEPSDSSSASLLTTENSFNEKADPVCAQPNWRKRKMCGKIPMGIFVAVLMLLLVCAIALGAAIGTIIVKKHHNEQKEGEGDKPHDPPLSQVTGPNGSLFDAVPIPTPSGLSPLPTGAFALPLGIPQESNPGCLARASQYSAWSCKMTFAPLVLTINDTSEIPGCQQFASMKQGSSIPSDVILYGLQTPQLEQEFMDLVVDLDYKAYGPAFHFKTRYDKLVILRPEELSGSQDLTTRRSESVFRQHFIVRPGDMPWYCFWNETYIEGYIYATDNSSAASYTIFPSQSSTSPTPTSSDSIAINAASAATMTSGSSTHPTPSTGATPTAAPPVRRDASSSSDPAAPPRMFPYPRIVKIEERRVPNSPPPYCQRMLLLDNGIMTTAPNGPNGPLRIMLQEQDPTYEEYIAASEDAHSKRDALPEDIHPRSDPSSACHCQWMFN